MATSYTYVTILTDYMAGTCIQTTVTAAKGTTLPPAMMSWYSQNRGGIPMVGNTTCADLGGSLDGFM